MKKLFVVITRGRTGSTPFVDDLDKHPQIACYQELFRQEPLRDYHDKVPSYALLNSERGGLSAEEYIELIVRQSEQAAIVGFKLLIPHFDERPELNLWQVLVARNAKIIYLTRDFAAAALSGAIARERGLFNVHRDSAYVRDQIEAAKRPVTIDVEWLCEEIENSRLCRAEWNAKLQDSGLDYLNLEYEFYVANRQSCVGEAYAFLQVPPFEVNTINSYERVTSENVWDDVTNADEVISTLQERGCFEPPDKERLRAMVDGRSRDGDYVRRRRGG